MAKGHRQLRDTVQWMRPVVLCWLRVAEVTDRGQAMKKTTKRDNQECTMSSCVQLRSLVSHAAEHAPMWA